MFKQLFTVSASEQVWSPTSSVTYTANGTQGMANITKVVAVCNNIEKEEECLATESLV